MIEPGLAAQTTTFSPEIITTGVKIKTTGVQIKTTGYQKKAMRDQSKTGGAQIETITLHFRIKETFH